MTFYEAIEAVGKAIDGVGVAVIAIGALIAAVWAVTRLRAGSVDVYRSFRERLGRSILLGLEFLVAADIIRTVAVTPDAKSVAVLGGIVLIRTFLSFSLQLEVTGYWPWQAARARQVQTQPPPPPPSAQPLPSAGRHAHPEAPVQNRPPRP
ncbi:MAG: DUF1622 domain-containing protein [Mycobacterium sp.]